MKIEIANGAPIPPPAAGRSKYPFADMQPGDSFIITLEAGDETDLTGLQNTVATIGRKFHGTGAISTRKFRSKGCLQVWRVK